MKIVSRIVIYSAFIAAFALMGVMLTGCQTPGTVASDQAGDVCPMCHSQTVTSSVTGLTYTKHVCPDCKTVSTIDPASPMSMQDYIDPLEQTVVVCDGCEAVVSPCPKCRAM